MTSAALIADLRSRGVTLVPDGDLLRCRPKSSLTKDDVAALRANKPEVLRLLRKEQRAGSSQIVCYSCRSRRFWRSIYGPVTCAVCHPPAAEHLVQEWIEAAVSTADDHHLGRLTDQEVQARIDDLRRLESDHAGPGSRGQK